MVQLYLKYTSNFYNFSHIKKQELYPKTYNPCSVIPINFIPFASLFFRIYQAFFHVIKKPSLIIF